MRKKIYSDHRKRLNSLWRNILQNEWVMKLRSHSDQQHSEMIDPTTHVYNQHGINSYLKELFHQDEHGYAIVLLHVDDFKKLNEQHGKKFAEKALVTISNTLSQHLRDTDLIGRYGDEEFIFILSDINQHNAEAVAKRCHQAVQKAKYYIGRKRYSLSVSLGVANSSTEFTSQQVLQQSDEALFSAKNKGGNQVHVAS